jgi:hypothetical protein
VSRVSMSPTEFCYESLCGEIWGSQACTSAGQRLRAARISMRALLFEPNAGPFFAVETAARYLANYSATTPQASQMS